MRSLKPDQQPLDIRQLLAIARDIQKAEPGITMPDFIEAIKYRIVRLGFAYPSAEMLNTVIQKVMPVQAPDPVTLPPASKEARPLTREEAQATLAMLLEKFKHQ